MKRKPIEYNIDIYEKRVIYFIGWSCKEYEDYILKRFNIEPAGEQDWQGTCIFYQGNVLLWVKDSKKLDVLSHECLHGALSILENIGFKLDYKNQEPLAYLFDSIFRKALESIKKTRNKK